MVLGIEYPEGVCACVRVCVYALDRDEWKSVTAGYRCVGGVHTIPSRKVNQPVLPSMTYISAHAVFLLHFTFLGVQTVVGRAAMLLAGRA